jgi:biopolymer transport protein ExbD
VAVNNPDEVPNLDADLTVVLRTQNDGSNNGLISHISVKGRSGETTLGSLDELKKYLQENKGSLENKDDVKIEADSRLKWGSVVQAMDVCKKAGFRIGFGQPPDLAVGP